MEIDRVRRLEAERHEEEKRFNSLVAKGDDWEETQSSLEKLHELDGAIIEARRGVLTGDGAQRP